jgi:uncharacterized protein (DUF983 family)
VIFLVKFIVGSLFITMTTKLIKETYMHVYLLTNLAISLSLSHLGQVLSALLRSNYANMLISLPRTRNSIINFVFSLCLPPC